MTADHAEAERLAESSYTDEAVRQICRFANSVIDQRDAEIARLQQERDAATREAEALRATSAEQEDYARIQAKVIGENTAELKALREEVGRLRDFMSETCLRNGCQEPGEAPAQPSADDVERARGIMADVIYEADQALKNDKTYTRDGHIQRIGTSALIIARAEGARQMRERAEIKCQPNPSETWSRDHLWIARVISNRIRALPESDQ